jgi:uncharacterized membrane protein
MQLPIDCFSWLPPHPPPRARWIALVWIGFRSAHGHKGGSQTDVIVFEEIVFMFRGECFWIYNDCVKERLGNILAGRTKNGGGTWKGQYWIETLYLCLSRCYQTRKGNAVVTTRRVLKVRLLFCVLGPRTNFVAHRRSPWLNSLTVFVVFLIRTVLEIRPGPLPYTFQVNDSLCNLTLCSTEYW